MAQIPLARGGSIGIAPQILMEASGQLYAPVGAVVPGAGMDTMEKKVCPRRESKPDSSVVLQVPVTVF
jgi:hypothetical protein